MATKISGTLTSTANQTTAFCYNSMTKLADPGERHTLSINIVCCLWQGKEEISWVAF